MSWEVEAAGFGQGWTVWRGGDCLVAVLENVEVFVAVDCVLRFLFGGFAHDVLPVEVTDPSRLGFLLLRLILLRPFLVSL